MIRVLHYGLSPNRGGIETYLDKIWTNIDKKEFHFDFADEHGGRTFFRDKFEKMGSTFYDITPRRVSLLKNTEEWRNILQSVRPDILHCHLNTMSYIAPAVIALKLGIHVVVHSRSAGSVKKLFVRFRHYINRMRLRRKKITRLAVSTEAGNWLFGSNAEYTVINNGIDIMKFSYCEEGRIKVRTELGLSPRTLVIGNVGALIPAKNQEQLLDIYRAVSQQKKDSVLIIAGEGYLRPNLEEKAAQLGISDKVIFLGNRSDMRDVYSAADVFVMPSAFEGFPNAALEAQTSGLPCVLSDIITKEVNMGACRYKSLSDESSAWASAILEVAADATEENRAELWRVIDSKGYSKEKELERLSSIYKGVCQK